MIHFVLIHLTAILLFRLQTPKDASMLGWVMEMGASQAAIAEHAKPTLSDEQQTGESF